MQNPRTRPIAALAAALLIGVLLWWFSGSGLRDRSFSASQPSLAASRLPDALEGEVLTPGGVDPASPSRRGRQAMESEESSTEAEVPSSASPCILVGSTILTLAPFEGDGTVILREAQSGAMRSVSIRSGRVAPETELVAGFVIDHLELDGREAEPAHFEVFNQEGLEAATLEAIWDVPLAISVVDQDTGDPLDAVTCRYTHAISPRVRFALAQALMARRFDGFPGWTFGLIEEEPPRSESPGGELLVASGSSPVRVLEAGRTGTLWFTAPGHEWRAWPPAESGAPIVRLRRTGVLTVDFDGEISAREGGSRLTVTRQGGRAVDPWVRDVRPASVSVFDRLRAGDYLVRWIRNSGGVTIDQSRVRIEAGAESRVLLHIAGKEERRSLLSGSLFFEDQTVVGIEPKLDLETESGKTFRSLTLVPLGAHRFRIEPVLVRPGPYILAVPDWPFAWSVDLRANVDVSLEVRDLRDRMLHVTTVSGNPVSLDDLEWIPEDCPDADIHFATLLPGPSTVLPAGRVFLNLGSGQTGHQTLTIEILRGQRDVEIRMRERMSLEFVIDQGGEQVLPTFGWLSAVVLKDDAGNIVKRGMEWTFADGSLGQGRLFPDRSGVLWVHAPDIPGLPHIPPTRIDLTPGTDRSIVLIGEEPVGLIDED